MKRKTIWLLASCLMVAALVLASCGKAEEEEEVTPPPAEEEEVTPPPAEEEEEPPAKEMVRDVLGRLVEKPQYGGVFNLAYAQDLYGFDEVKNYSQALVPTQELTNEELVGGDWAKGPAGTGEASWLVEEFLDPYYAVGVLAESWEVPDSSTIIWHLRQGIHFHNKPPVNGREFVADDYVFSRERLMTTKTSWHYGNYDDTQRAAFSVRALDKYTVEEKWVPGRIGEVLRIGGNYSFVIPHEVIDMYGDINDWKNACGTGPFILKDYVPSSSATLVRNPDYWGKHPIFPEDTMPYVDTFKFIIITDLSTRLSALRTGKVDTIRGLGRDDAVSMMQTNPDLKYLKYFYTFSPEISMRMDNPELPFKDIRVRRALHMGIDMNEFSEIIYGGEAAITPSPLVPVPEFEDFYIPLEELPESVQELFVYNPEKAKQLLAEAGYPNGFKTELLIWTGQSDSAAVLQAYWQKIGVDAEINVKEYSVYISMALRRTHSALILDSAINGTPRSFNDFRPANYNNRSYIDDPILNQAYEDCEINFFDWQKVGQIYKDITPHLLEQVYTIRLPTPYIWTFWQPWVKGYYGEYSLDCWKLYRPYIFLWIDQDLKYEMTGIR